VKAAPGAHAKLLGVKAGTVVCLYFPLPSQVLFEECAAKNILWGGQAGPGKSHGVRWWLYKRCLTTPQHEALLVRENWEQLEKTHLRKMAQELPLLGAKLVDRTAVFDKGSFIDCGHMADAEAVARYLSTGYGAIVADEASQVPVDGRGLTPLAELSTRARVVLRSVTGAVVKPRFLLVSNPGGPSASWLRDMFVDHTPDYGNYPKLRPVFDEHGAQVRGYTAEKWAYIPARLDDNPYQDPEYEDTLANLTEERYLQLRHGDWHVFPGQFFHEYRAETHVRSLEIGRGVEWFASMDWGYNAPGVCLWWACLPDGHYHIRAEYKFQGQSAETVAAAIKRVTKELGIGRLRYLVADPALWQHTGAGKGEAIAETLQRRGLPMRKGDNDRFNGWLRCHELLALAPDGTPWWTIDTRCPYGLRSLPSQVSDRRDPDDVDTHGDDHWVDAWRYGAMSRPSPTRVHQPAPRRSMLAEHVAERGRSSVLGAENVSR
jgi:hypothetical protein